MTPLRFSGLSAPRQTLIRQCQQIGFGRILGLVVRDSEPVFAERTELLVDLKLETDEYPRPEQSLDDFAVSAEIVRLFSKLEAIRDGVIEYIEVRAGVPRRIVYKTTGAMR